MKLSIIIPAHNNSEFLKPLLEKLMKQKTDEVEIIVAEDGSTEDMSFIDTFDVISIHHENRLLPSGARNIGIDLAKGKYITFLDSDDDIIDDYISTLLDMMKTNADCYSYRFYADRNGCPSWKQEEVLWSYNVWSYLFKKDYIGDKRFDENKEFMEDIDFLRKVVVGGKIEHIDKFMVIYNNENPTSQSHKYEELKKKGKYNENSSRQEFI